MIGVGNRPLVVLAGQVTFEMSELVDDLKILRRLWLAGGTNWGCTAEWEQVTERLFHGCDYPEKMYKANGLADALGWGVVA